MHCKSCEILIKDSLEETKGIKKVNINKEIATIEFDESQISENNIKKIIEKEGYKVE